MKKLLKTILLTCLLFSCNKLSYNEEYILQEMQIANESMDVLDKNVSISFDENKISGLSFVNVYSSAYKLRGNRIKVDSILTTKAAGTEEDEKLEDKYLSLLKSVDKIKLDENKKVVAYNEKTNDKLVYIKRVSENDLDKNKYKLISNSKISMSFDGNNIYGESTVNTYFATYTIKNNKMKINNIAATLKAGSNYEMKKESEFFDKLAQEYVVNIYKDTLILTNDKEKLVFVKLIKEK